MSHAEGEPALLESIREDAPGAFDRFVAAYGDRLYGFGIKMCGEREDARDIVQETLLQAYRSLRTLKEPAALRSWLYRVASNACLMKRRRGKFEPDRELSLEELMPRGPGRAGLELRDDASLPEDDVLREETRRAVRQAIRSLPAHYRIVLILRDMEQLSTRETSEALDLPESTVKMRLHRARLGVRKYLEEHPPGDSPGRTEAGRKSE